MVPSSRPWAILGRSLLCIVKLAPILWWALPSGPQAVHPQFSRAVRIPFSDTTAIMKLNLLGRVFPGFACLHLKELNITRLCSFCSLFPGLCPVPNYSHDHH
ncbi:hypothetical protein DSO57_1020528 [Entomophthora muscae]|uniref:Uncharacterized protein n=1 Tax=Entomophthora muscae TaxID=34485 RepID=A0ACC2S5V1_9FUNG|nr:hypothetical protein DSO57_1020528 [Entomophthora muscae]